MGRTVVGLALALGLLSGCGSREDAERRDAERGAQKALDTYMQALREGDCRTAWECLTWKRRQELSLEQIQEDYAKHRDRYFYRAAAKVQTTHYDGFRVIAKLVDGEGRLEFVCLLPEEGGWKIEGSGKTIADVLRRMEPSSGGSSP